jgi:hypothetical protein
MQATGRLGWRLETMSGVRMCRGMLTADGHCIALAQRAVAQSREGGTHSWRAYACVL